MAERISFEERYRKTPGGCWEWSGSRHQRGYGRLIRDGKTVAAHRYSYERHNGTIPHGQHVLHRCDNPPCVNPEHLFLGTHVDNMADMAAKGRARSGRSGPPKKLSADQRARVIREYVEGGISQRSIARQFGISQSLVSLLVNGKA